MHNYISYLPPGSFMPGQMRIVDRDRMISVFATFPPFPGTGALVLVKR